MHREVVLSSFVLFLSTATNAQIAPAPSDSSPSGVGVSSHSATTGTANYPTDPKAASPSANGNTPVAERHDAEANGNGQAPTDADDAAKDHPKITAHR
jgi:hypothetical protein